NGNVPYQANENDNVGSFNAEEEGYPADVRFFDTPPSRKGYEGNTSTNKVGRGNFNFDDDIDIEQLRSEQLALNARNMADLNPTSSNRRGDYYDSNGVLHLEFYGANSQQAPLTDSVIQEDPGYFSSVGNIFSAYSADKIDFGGAASMLWQNTKYYFKGSDTAQGLTQAVGGGLEIWSGTALSGTGLGAPIGLPLAFHGGDNVGTGLSRMFFGRQFNTVTYNGVEALTGSQRAARLVDNGIPFVAGIAGGSQLVEKYATKSLLRAESTTALRKLGSRGNRNEEILTAAQEVQLHTHIKELGLNSDDFVISTHMSSYSDFLDVTFLGPNMFPATTRSATTVFETLTPRAAVAHEAGHMITTRAGTAFEPGSLFDEVGASLTGRSLPGLNSVERYQLLRDAAERARNEGQRLRDVLSEMKNK
ncbi:MAG: hypothetical protein RL368_1957, partial [Pseudomonadota bacterium]